jgi:hypothetical protein
MIFIPPNTKRRKRRHYHSDINYGMYNRCIDSSKYNDQQPPVQNYNFYFDEDTDPYTISKEVFDMIQSKSNIPTTPYTPTTNGSGNIMTPAPYIPTTSGGYTQTTPGGYIPTTSGGYIPTTSSGYIPTTSSGYIPTTSGEYIPTTYTVEDFKPHSG